ncbi:MAG: VCBS repeat-containing protein, partial [Bacteroidota bacterium]
MKCLSIVFGLYLMICPALSAQVYLDASANLPNAAAMGASMDVQAADLDADGDLDIVLANEFQGNTILWNDGTATFSSTASALPQMVHDSEDVAIADFDQDGDLDLFFCSEDDVDLGGQNVHEYYWNDGTGQFTVAPYQAPDSKANALLAADLNNDGFPDLIFGNIGQNRILINQQNGFFADETLTRLPSFFDSTQDLQLGDLDGDEDLDLIVGNEDGNRLLINDGTGQFADETISRLP